MKKNKPTKSGINCLTGRVRKFNRAILLVAVVCAAVTCARATQVVNVAASPYFAVGDATTDNKTRIQNAVNWVSQNGGGTVYFPLGLYNVSGAIDIHSNVRLQGTGSTLANGTQIRLFPKNATLFNIKNGATNVVFKDLFMVALGETSTYPRSSDKIRAENTVGISFEPGELETSDIVIENVRINLFTEGISAPDDGGYNTSIKDVKIRGYASDGNEYSLVTDTTRADGWDVQNMNVYPMYDKQNGIYLKRSGDMRFLQLSCAGADASNIGGVCAKLLDNGDIYFRQMHLENNRLGICAGGHCDPDNPDANPVANSSRITIESSATNGEFLRATDLVSINNRYWTAKPAPVAYTFTGDGANSSFRSCGDVWLAAGAGQADKTTVTIPDGVFYGLPNPSPLYASCLESDLTAVPVFNTGYEPDNKRLPDIEVNVTSFYYNGIHYSATPNNSSDDTLAFTKAILAAASTGKRVYVPPGRFDISLTLEIPEGLTILGEGTISGNGQSVINLTAGNMSLFKIKNALGAVHGVTVRNLRLTSDSDVGTVGINFENYDVVTMGAASDFQVQNVDAHGFEVGIAVLPVAGDWANPHPMFDSVSIKDGDFSKNKTAILVQSTVASSWNLEDIRVNVPDGRDGVRVNGGGVSVRNLSCEGSGAGQACLTIQRSGVVPVENLTATGVENALLVPWENGWTPFPVTVRNSNLTEGVYFQGRIFLNSVNNIYPALITSQFSKLVKIGAFQEGNIDNKYYGGQSEIFTCDDVFVDVGVSQNTWLYSGTLINSERYCN